MPTGEGPHEPRPHEEGSHDACLQGQAAVPHVFAASCASRFLLEQVADKWSVLVVSSLWEGPLRFNALRRRIEGITQKALTDTLRRLERNGMVARRVIPASPVAVEYSLTEIGQSLRAPFAALHDWTVAHGQSVVRARTEFDRRREGA